MYFSSRGIGKWQMTEFDIGAENGVAGRQFDLCLQDGDSIDCEYRGK